MLHRFLSNRQYMRFSLRIVTRPDAYSTLSNRKTFQLVCQTILLLHLVTVVAACSVLPHKKIIDQAEVFGFSHTMFPTDKFDLLMIRNFDKALVAELHVYLEGDGSPWFMRVFKSRDPTPRRALMLELMSYDNNSSIYLGRPCYNQSKKSPACTADVWTSGRYSSMVVESMIAAITEEAERLGVQRIKLFGHSGGGTLAVLLAEKLPQVSNVVTLAGNLNTDAWVEHHSFAPLHSSLNPAKRPALPHRVEQVHFVAGIDKNIPPALVRDWVLSQANAFGVSIGNFDHGCCWATVWPEVLQSLERGKPYSWPGEVFKRPTHQ